MATPTADELPELVVEILGRAEVREFNEEQIDEVASRLQDPANRRVFTGEVVDLMSLPGEDLTLTVPDTMSKKDLCDDYLRIDDTNKKAWSRMVVLCVARSGQAESPTCLAHQHNCSGPFEHCFTLGGEAKSSMGCATYLKRYHDAGQDECIRCSFEK